MTVAILILLNAILWGAVIYFYRRDHLALVKLLEHHHDEHRTDQERVDALIEALANSKGVSYVARGPSGELIQAPTYWGDPGRRYWDINRPITDTKVEEEPD